MNWARGGFLVPFFCFGTLAPGFASEAWQYPEDIPVIAPVSVGLAGEQPADIVRYLMARGATLMAISPDGSQVAFGDRVSGETQLWIVDAQGGWPRQLTFGKGIRSARWAPEGHALLVARDTDGDEREGYYLLSADGLKEREVLPPTDAFRSFGMFSPDGNSILFASTERNGRDFDLYTTNLKSGETKMVYEGSFGFYARAWQPGGRLIIVDETRGEDGNDVHLLDLDTGEMRPLFQPEQASSHKNYQWLPDGSGFYLSTNNGRDFSGLAFVALDSANITYLETPELNVEDVKLSGDGRYLVWKENHDGYSRLKVRDLESGSTSDGPDDLPRGVYSIDLARSAHRLSVRVSAPAIPGDVHVIDLSSGALSRPVPSSLAGLDPKTFVQPESLRYKARDDVNLQGFLYRPPKADSLEKVPVVVRVHGGPSSQAKPTFRAQIQYLVNHGIAVFDVNVRGSTGFGKRFASLDNQEKRLDSVRDLVDTVEFLKTVDGIDAERAGVMGGSYGGYMVNAVLGSYPGVFAAGASFVGVSDWVRALEEASPALKASDRIEYGDIREERWQEFYAENSPINNADRINVPLFVEHGANDPRDPVGESDRIVQTVRDLGGEVTYLRFPDEGHGIGKQANRVAFNRALMAFLEQHLRGDASSAQH
ncbi:MAG: S9 family peptidase [Pseudomonadota bacterium]